MLGAAPFDEAAPVLRSLLEPDQPLPVQRAALAVLAAFDEAEVARIVLEAWSSLGPELRPAAVGILLERQQRIAELLEAVEDERFDAGHLSQQQVDQLLSSTDGDLRQRAKDLLSERVAEDRRAVIDRYRRAMAELEGDARRGRAVFAETCAACHQLEDRGIELGPSLAAFAQQRGRNAMLENLFAPNREVNPQYVSYIVETTDGRTLAGMIKAETATSVTLTYGEGTEQTVLRNEIASMRSTGRSIMPDGLEATLSPQDVADLWAYLSSV